MRTKHTAECVTAQESSAREICICGDSEQSKIDRAYYFGGVITIGATEHGGRWDHNTHRIVLKEELADKFIGWPDPTDPHCSDQWKPGIDRPLEYPKFAWELR
jgi:hypothetical protein